MNTMKTLTLFKIDFQGNEVLIPVLEDAKELRMETQVIYDTLQSEESFKIFKEPIWQYISSDNYLKEFCNTFFKENEGRVLKYLQILEKDFENIKIIDTPLGVVYLPTEKAYSIPVIVKKGFKSFTCVEDTELPVLVIIKGK